MKLIKIIYIVTTLCIACVILSVKYLFGIRPLMVAILCGITIIALSQKKKKQRCKKEVLIDVIIPISDTITFKDEVIKSTGDTTFLVHYVKK